MIDIVKTLSQRSDLPIGLDISLISPYLLPLPQTLPDNSQFQMKLVKHYKDSVDSLVTKIEAARKILKDTEDTLEEKKLAKPDEIENQPQLKDDIQLYKVLYSKMNKLRIKISTMNVETAKKQLTVLLQLDILAKWLASNPLPIIINIERATPKTTAKTFSSDQYKYKKFRALKIALREQISMINHSPYAFRMSNENRKFVRSVVDAAMAARKANTSYFESPTVEESLFKFFDHHNSPIYKAGLLPINVGNDPDEVINWINRAAATIAALDGIQISERREVINVFVVRYFFERTYPQFQPEVVGDDAKFTETRERVLRMKPEEAHIPKKYIPPSCLDLPVSKLFESSSIAKAPALWMSMMQFKCCPLDVAYYIFKVHESLSIMATLQATENSQGTTSEDFYSKMPGFDDIFDLWLCLVCYADLADPRGMNNFVGNWTRLPGFPQRFVACCAYLEAAVSQIEALGEEEQK